jgi:protein-S-isoprenylcysteine O-methyltransferase Ste14
MGLERALAVSAAYFTWIPFGFCMRCYFRGSRTANRTKDWLVRCGAACSLAQMALLPRCSLPAPPFVYGGVAALAVANALFWGSLATHGRKRPNFAFCPAAPTSFTASGPYRLVRHPIYVAYLLGWLGGTVASGQFWLLALVAVLAVFYYRAARQEEQLILASPLGPRYRAYCRRTGMFLPHLRPASRRPANGRTGRKAPPSAPPSSAGVVAAGQVCRRTEAPRGFGHSSDPPGARVATGAATRCRPEPGEEVVQAP